MDQDGMLRLLTRERRLIQAFTRAMVSDYHLAEDILQDVFVVALQRRDQFVEGTSFPAWVREIVRRVSLAQLRKAGRGAASLDDRTLDLLAPALQVPEESWEEERRALQSCVGSLPAESRRVLALRYVEEAPLERIAGDVGRSVDGIKGLLKRLRQKLAECVAGKLRLPGETPA